MGNVLRKYIMGKLLRCFNKCEFQQKCSFFLFNIYYNYYRGSFLYSVRFIYSSLLVASAEF